MLQQSPLIKKMDKKQPLITNNYLDPNFLPFDKEHLDLSLIRNTTSFSHYRIS